MTTVVESVTYRCPRCGYCLKGLPVQSRCSECGAAYRATGPDWKGARFALERAVHTHWSFSISKQLTRMRSKRRLPLLIFAMIITSFAFVALQMMGTYVGFHIDTWRPQRANVYAEFGRYGTKGALFKPNWAILIVLPFIVFLQQGVLIVVIGQWYRHCQRAVQNKSLRRHVLLMAGGSVPMAVLLLGLIGGFWHVFDIGTGNSTYRVWGFHVDQVSEMMALLRAPFTQISCAAAAITGFLIARCHIHLGRKLKGLLGDVQIRTD